MTANEVTTIAGRLREAREAAGLSQGQVAKKLELHRPTISEIEAGRRKVSSSEVDQFAKIYGVTVQWLVNGATEADPSDTSLLIAARELSRMSAADLDKLAALLRMVRKDS